MALRDLALPIAIGDPLLGLASLSEGVHAIDMDAQFAFVDKLREGLEGRPFWEAE